MRTFHLFSIILFLAISAAQAADNPPPQAAPAFLDVVNFEYSADGENHKVVVTNGPALLRVDELDDRYSVIYNPQTDFYTGLEHGNYTYWEFSWPEIRDEVENSKRHEARLQMLSNEGLNSEPTPSSTNPLDPNTPVIPPDASTPSTKAPTSTSVSASDDDSGYVWHATNEKKRIGDYDCIRWTGDTVSGENVEAWCYNGLLPKVQTAIENMRKINEPIALVPVRTIAPDFIFPVYAALFKGGVTPLQINWGDGQSKNYFRFISARTRDGKLSLFTVPKLYVKTTLVTMDGMIKEQPAAGARTNAPAKTWQN